MQAKTEQAGGFHDPSLSRQELREEHELEEAECIVRETNAKLEDPMVHPHDSGGHP